MGSRIGSIAILLFIGAIVAAVVVIISRLDLLDTGEPDAPVIVVSIDDGELVLLNEPQSITVTISSGSPIATLELLVDESVVAEVIPPYSAERGAWIGTFVWTPERLGFATVNIVALDAQGVEFSRVLQVEVTDDQARVAATLRLAIEGIAPLQQFPTGAVIRIEVEARGGRPIERIDMLLDDRHGASVSPRLQADGTYRAAFEWAPTNPGEFNVTFVAVDADGRSETQIVPVLIIEPGRDVSPSDARSTIDQADSDPDTESDSEDPDVFGDGIEGQARIEFPADGQQFTLDDEFALDVQLTARGVGPIASALLYLTPVAPNNTLGNSVLIHSSEAQDGGDFNERVENVERWITSSGTYELQLVAFTPEQVRYDHRIRFHVVADAGSGESQSDPAESELSDEIDLAIVTARQAADDPRRLNVSITNSSSMDIERINVLITVADANDGAELAAVEVTLDIASEDLRTIPLDLDLEDGVEVNALIVLEASGDANSGNNVFPITLAAPPVEPGEQGDRADSSEEDSLGQDGQDSGTGQSQPPTTPGAAPDLSLLDVQATSDGFVLLTVVNVGAAPASTFTIQIADAAGALLETIARRDADSRPLDPGIAEILTSLQPHSGIVVITVVASSADGEVNLSDNVVTFEIP
ncbi:MAG: hypothetical protein F4W99_10425 [Chloroflexi bacterium]|nr:hypothetical protein [Chloroflexota bacterium]MYJ02070.1 hypothetical protein [Chloroflexota bacterium]